MLSIDLNSYISYIVCQIIHFQYFQEKIVYSYIFNVKNHLTPC